MDQLLGGLEHRTELECRMSNTWSGISFSSSDISGSSSWSRCFSALLSIFFWRRAGPLLARFELRRPLPFLSFFDLLVSPDRCCAVMTETFECFEGVCTCSSPEMNECAREVSCVRKSSKCVGRVDQAFCGREAGDSPLHIWLGVGGG